MTKETRVGEVFLIIYVCQSKWGCVNKEKQPILIFLNIKKKKKATVMKENKKKGGVEEERKQR